MVPLALLVIFFGVYPSPILDVTAVSVDNLLTNAQAAIEAYNAAGATGSVAGLN
jgi:NADH-quinone oxidoreductase subunit M